MVTLHKSCNMLKFNFCGKKHAVPIVCKTDGHIILNRIFEFPAQPSPLPGTMENTIFAYLTKKCKYLKSDFFVLSSNLFLATERTKSRERFVLKSVDFGQFITLILAFTSKTGQSVVHNRHGISLFGFYWERMDILYL